MSITSTTTDLMRIYPGDLLENPANRVPITLCLDVSGSMSGEPIAELNKGVELFFDALRIDPVANASAEVAIVAFADRAEVMLDFQSLDRVAAPPVLQTGSHVGCLTNLGAGAQLAMSILESRKQQYKIAGVDYFQPFMILMTDGQPTTEEHLTVAARACELEGRRKLTVIPIGIGGAADMKVLAMFSQKRPPLRLKGLRFEEFFLWLSKSVVRLSQSQPGERVRLDPTSGWGSI